jgi:hypothetical protein
MTAKDRRRIAKLFALLGSPNQGERDNARHKLDALLQRLGKSWNDLPELLQPDAQSASPSDPRDTTDPVNPFDASNAPTPADTVRRMLESYVTLDEHEYVAVALWIIHTHVFDRFMVTPRLLLTSPVRNCGKTTLLDVASRLVARPKKTDSITAAVIYHNVNVTRSTLLLDEADNLELAAKAVLRSVLNAGHRRGGSVDRLIRGWPVAFDVFAPVALASIGSLTLPLVSRSIVISMRRHDGAQTLRRFDAADTADLDVVYSHIRHWVRQVELGQVALNRDPDMPAGMHGRQADNWRPLLSIGDACGPAWSAQARDAAIAFTRSERDEDLPIILLRHLRDIFNALRKERLPSKLLVDNLLDLDEMWSEFRGVRGDERPRKLTQGQLAMLLRPFKIVPRKFWPPNRDATTKNFRGYARADFEAAWRAYCSEAGTPDHRYGVQYLRRA